MRTGIAVFLAGLLVLLLPGCGGDGSKNVDGGNDGGGCTNQQPTPVDSPAYTASDSCAGVMENQVFRDAEAANAHHAAYCDTVAACSGGGCIGAIGWTIGKMMIYVAGTASGCDATATIEGIRACDGEIQVDYRVVGEGLCGTVINAWAAVWVDHSDLPVTFKLLD